MHTFILVLLLLMCILLSFWVRRKEGFEYDMVTRFDSMDVAISKIKYQNKSSSQTDMTIEELVLAYETKMKGELDVKTCTEMIFVRRFVESKTNKLYMNSQTPQLINAVSTSFKLYNDANVFLIENSMSVPPPPYSNPYNYKFKIPYEFKQIYFDYPNLSIYEINYNKPPEIIQDNMWWIYSYIWNKEFDKRNNDPNNKKKAAGNMVYFKYLADSIMLTVTSQPFSNLKTNLNAYYPQIDSYFVYNNIPKPSIDEERAAASAATPAPTTPAPTTPAATTPGPTTRAPTSKELEDAAYQNVFTAINNIYTEFSDWSFRDYSKKDIMLTTNNTIISYKLRGLLELFVPKITPTMSINTLNTRRCIEMIHIYSFVKYFINYIPLDLFPVPPSRGLTDAKYAIIKSSELYHIAQDYLKDVTLPIPVPVNYTPYNYTFVIPYEFKQIYLDYPELLIYEIDYTKSPQVLAYNMNQIIRSIHEIYKAASTDFLKDKAARYVVYYKNILDSINTTTSPSIFIKGYDSRINDANKYLSENNTYNNIINGIGANITTPAATTPAETTPAETMPAETMPAATTPAETTPAETTPAETTPAETTPAETTPAETTPAWTTSYETMPAETTPAWTTSYATPAETTPAWTTSYATTSAEITPAWTTSYSTTPARTTHASPSVARPVWESPLLTTSLSDTTSYYSGDPVMQRYYDNYKEYLKDNTNTTYDEYVGREILKKGDSASAYLRRTPDPKNRSVDENIKERTDLISYFINLFKKNSLT